MIYLIPTKRGLGATLWGTFDDLQSLYDVVGKFWSGEEKPSVNGLESRDKIICVFSYDIRHAFQGSRQISSRGHFSTVKCDYYGIDISWVQLLFSINALRFNMSHAKASKYDVSLLMQLEYWIEESMLSFDPITASKLLPFINGGIYAANIYLYQYMTSIDVEYFSLGGGRSNFKKLPLLLEKSVLMSKPYKLYLAHLEREGKRLKCDPGILDNNDDHILYDELVW